MCIGADGEDNGPFGGGLEAVAQPCDGAIGAVAVVGGVEVDKQACIFVHEDKSPLLKNLVALLPVATGDKIGEKLSGQLLWQREVE